MVRTLVILKEDPGSVPPASTRQLRDIHNFSSEESNTLFRLLQAPGTLVVEKKKKENSPALGGKGRQNSEFEASLVFF